MILTHQSLETSRRLLRLTVFLFLLPLLGCAQPGVGHLSGQVPNGNLTSQVDVNFSAISFPAGGDNQLIIKLTNLSNHSATFTLAAKDTEATTITGKFPTGNYSIGTGNSNLFAATLPGTGTSTIDATGVNGTLNLTVLTVGVDANNNTAVAQIKGDFQITLADGGAVTGSFEKDFTQ